jgi:hypothetical protein
MGTSSGGYPAAVAGYLASLPYVMGMLSDPSIALLHVSLQNPDGPDTRLDACPCPRGPETLEVDAEGRPVYVQLGGGQYISSGMHTLADLVRDIAGITAGGQE